MTSHAYHARIYIVAGNMVGVHRGRRTCARHGLTECVYKPHATVIPVAVRVHAVCTQNAFGTPCYLLFRGSAALGRLKGARLPRWDGVRVLECVHL